MATSYSEIYEAFIYKIEGYKLMMLLEEDREKIISKYMKAVCRKIHNKCKNYVDLSDRDDTLEQFNTDIGEEVVDIIAESMITEWLKPKIYSDELLESRLNTKDFTEFSNANLIKQAKEVYLMSAKTSLALVNNYTYSHDDIADVNKP